MKVLRFAGLILAATISLASQMGPKSSAGPASPPPAPRSPQNSPPAQDPGGPDGRFWCHGVAAGQGQSSQSSQSSLCFPGQARCERERQAAANDGLATSECTAAELEPACFQLGGDPNPSQSMCARTLEDCELWRQIDRDKNGAAPAQQPCALASQQPR